MLDGVLTQEEIKALLSDGNDHSGPMRADFAMTQEEMIQAITNLEKTVAFLSRRIEFLQELIKDDLAKERPTIAVVTAEPPTMRKAPEVKIGENPALSRVQKYGNRPFFLRLFK